MQQQDEAEKEGRPAEIGRWSDRFLRQGSLAKPKAGLLKEGILGRLAVRVVAVLHGHGRVLDSLHPEFGRGRGEHIGFDHVQLDSHHDQKESDGHD